MITSDVLEAFRVTGEGERLEGGQGESWKFGEIVLKPVDNEIYYSFTAELWGALDPKEYRISKPVLSVNKRPIEKGYAATKYEVGAGNREAIKEKLIVSKHLHEDLKTFDIEKLPHTDDPWTKANDILWRRGSLPKNMQKRSRALCEKLIEALDEVDAKEQIVHADLGDNILFDEKLKPLVIDFSPTIAPVQYADAIIVCDSIAWYGAEIDVINYLQPLEEYKPFIQRAIAFRVLTAAMFEDTSNERVEKEWQVYKKIWEYINQ